jgi:hypothetical protein
MEIQGLRWGRLCARGVIAWLVLWGTVRSALAQTRPDFPPLSRIVYGPFGTPGIELKPFTINPRQTGDSLVDVSFLLMRLPEKKDSCALRVGIWSKGMVRQSGFGGLI